MIKPITLYANWVPLGKVNVDLDVGLGFPEEYDPNISADINSFSQDSASFTITLTVGDTSTYNRFEWYADTSKSVLLDTGDEITIDYALDATNVDWWQAGDHVITLLVYHSSSPSIKYSAEITITCSP